MIIEDNKELMILNNLIWERSLSRQKIQIWLNNFQGKVKQDSLEKFIALKLLKRFLYYNENEVKYLCQIILSMFKNIKIKENPEKYLNEKEEIPENNYLSKCKFSYIGRPGESGGYTLYLFRQYNDLSIKQCIEPNLLSNDNVDSFSDCDIIFIDDFLGTGDTARRFWENLIMPIKDRGINMNYYYTPLIAMIRGIEYVNCHTDFKIICPQILNDEYCAFSQSSTIFKNDDEKNIAREVCEEYGTMLVGKRQHSLGYKNSQALIGFHHNVPDNTLPIIWSDNNWHPIFKRIHKK
jgi:hypothetical protein